MQSSKKVLVTGGAGFLGSHLVEKLLHEGHVVTVFDNLHTGRLQNLSDIQDQCAFVHGDVISDLAIIEDSFDWIFNMACPASPPRYQENPIHTWKTSVIGTLRVLEMAHRTGARVFQASTSEVYGDPLEHPQTESYWGHVNPNGIRSCYDEGKRAAESLLFDYHREFGIDIRVARIFNTYGPRMDPLDGRVVSNFISSALKSEPFTVYGDGTQTRSFCYVSDLIEGIYALMSVDKMPDSPVNLGNPHEFSMLDLADCISEILDVRPGLIFHPIPHDDPKRRQPNIALAHTLLGWKPQVDLHEGIEKTILAFQKEMNHG